MKTIWKVVRLVPWGGPFQILALAYFAVVVLGTFLDAWRNVADIPLVGAIGITVLASYVWWRTTRYVAKHRPVIGKTAEGHGIRMTAIGPHFHVFMGLLVVVPWCFLGWRQLAGTPADPGSPTRSLTAPVAPTVRIAVLEPSGSTLADAIEAIADRHVDVKRLPGVSAPAPLAQALQLARDVDADVLVHAVPGAELAIRVDVTSAELSSDPLVLPPGEPAHTAVLYAIGVAGELAEDHDVAIARLGEIVAAHAFDPQAWTAPVFFWRGTAYLFRQQGADALHDLDIASALWFEDVILNRHRGYARLLIGGYPGAVSELDLYLARRPTDASALYYRAQAHLGGEDRAAAIADLTAALALATAPGFVGDLHIQRGDLYGDEGQPERAIEDYDAAAIAMPGSAMPVARRARVRCASGAFAAALADLQLAATLEPHEVAHVSLRASCKRRAGDLAGAEVDYDEVLRRKPTARAYMSRGRVKEARQRPVEARDDYQRALEIADVADEPAIVYHAERDICRLTTGCRLPRERERLTIGGPCVATEASPGRCALTMRLPEPLDIEP